MFENLWAFALLGLLPFFIVFMIFDIIKLRKRSKNIAGEKVKLIIPYYSEGQKWLRIVFYSLGFILFVFALARPRWGVETIDAKIKGRDILILLDTSYSMATPDIIPSRLEAAQRELNELLEMETGDRIGLMVFSGEYELMSPVTHDYSAVGFFLDSTYPNMLSKDGTDIGGAVLGAIEALDDNEPRNKMILLMTDGENLFGDYYTMLQKAKESNIRIYTVGVGTKNGEPIPLRNAKGEIESYVKDDSGKHVISRLDEKRLIEIAETTGGSYLRTTGAKGELKNFVESINGIERKERSDLKYEQKKERYNIFLIPALILFALGFILDQGRIYRIKGNKFEWLFNKNIVIILIVLCSLGVTNIYAKNDVSSDKKSVKDQKGWVGDPNGAFWGNEKFKKGDYKNALENYASVENSLRGNDLGKLDYNIGNTYLKLNDLKKAGEYLENSNLFLTDDKIKSMAYYNQGIVAFKNQDYKTASELFKKSLILNETDDDARYNYEVSKILDEKTKKQQQQQDQKQNQKKQDQKKEDQNKNKDNQLSKEDIEKLLKNLSEKEKEENRKKTEEDKNSNNGRSKLW
jgi:tetratricopeptide (TPR) repeat protein